MKERTVLLLLAVTLCQGAITSRKICPRDSENTLIAHENCNQYYQCVHGVLIARDCPPTLYFNPDAQLCDYPSNVNCGNDEDNEDIDNAFDSCSSGKAEGQFLVHENCDQYYWCVHGNLLEYTCNHGLLFNHETLRCDWSQNVNCKEVTLSPDTEAPNYTEAPNNTETPITETEKPDFEITPSPDICDDSCEDSENDESNSEQDSSESASYDSDEDATSESNSDENASSKENSDENHIDEDSNSNEDGYDEDKDATNENNSDESSKEASDENDIDEDNSSDDNSNEDDHDEESKYEDDINKICAVEGSDGVLIAHRDCRKFYKCSGGKPVVMSCPTDLLFNPTTEKCDWPSNVDCIDDGQFYLKKKLEIIVDVTVRGKKYA